MLAQVHELVEDKGDHPQAIFKPALHNDMLSDVVAELIGKEEMRTGTKLFDDDLIVFIIAVVHHALNHSAAVLVTRQHHDLAADSIHHEVKVLAVEQANHLLHHMVAILVECDAKSLGLQLLDQLKLLIDEHVLQCLVELAMVLYRKVFKRTFCTTRQA